MVLPENKPLTMQGQLALELYRCFFYFVDSASYPFEITEIDGSYFELQRTYMSVLPFLSPALKERLEKAFEEIAVPLTDEGAFDAEFVPEIGHFTEEGFFHVDNEALLRRTREKIIQP